MRVLFVSSGNSNEGIGVIVKNQGESLRNEGIDLSYFTINGKGIKGYLNAIFTLRKYLKNNTFDIVHAHYSLSGFVASISGASPLVVSLMGSDTYSGGVLKSVIRFFYSFCWDKTIVKTQKMKDRLSIKKAIVLPNGVDFKLFYSIDKVTARRQLNIEDDKKLLVFLADPNRHEKNYSLAENSVKLLNHKNLVLLPVFGIPNEKVSLYINAADALILTSKWEGSVNVVKEAMACNCPIISTDVGDVKFLINSIDGCFITSNDPRDIADKISLCLQFNARIKGRERITELGLDSITTAKKLISIYDEIIK